MRIEKQLISLLIIAIAVALVYSDILWRFDRLIYDTQIKLFASEPSKDIVIIEVDEKSLNMLGRWPWSRSIHAEMVDRLATVNTQGLGLNFIFAEPSLNPNDDEMLAKAITNHGYVVLPIIIEQGESSLIETLPLTSYAKAATLGHANVQLGKDGISRSVFLKAGLNHPHWPSMALALYGLKYPQRLKNISGQRQKNARSSLKQQIMGDYQAWLPFYKSLSGFQRVSYIDVLLNQYPISHFKGKYVLIGLTAGGLDYVVPTPLSVDKHPMTGTDYIASILDGLIKQSLWQPVPVLWQFLITVTLVSLSLLIYTWLPLNWALLSSSWLSFSLLFLNCFILRQTHYWFAPSAALLSTVMIYPFWSWQRLKNVISALFVEKNRALVTLNSIVDGVITINSNNEIDYLNPAIIKMLDAKDMEIRNNYKNDKFLLSTATNETSLSKIIKHSLESHSVQEFFRCSLKNASQSTLTVNLHITPLYDHKAKSIGIVLTIQDIREIMEMAQQLIQKNKEQDALKLETERARQASLAKSEFLSKMSHELRTPLNAILGFGQLMEMDDDEECPLSEENLDYVGEIIKAGHHLLDLINELLDLAKIESGKIELNITTVSVEALVKDCVTLILPMAQKHNIQLINNADNLAQNYIKADNKRCKQILLNLLSNAIKYNSKQGTVTLHGEINKTTIRFLITDTGSGLSSEEQDNLFKSFERLGANKTDIEGTGIGLVITKQLAELMAGNVGVESIVGEGSTFWLELPIADNVENELLV